ncbi:Acetyltransferase (GNAT) family protein [Blastococcus sp. DSM 46786]|uniref:GNAT family N-acetyltransferase n=1 Tax=Blastococcus sp. DSM 46786 TaxID=1798227 RepID=UPI0008BACADC|nr:GNAT family N-acetyltransferase [Blastococcus sp. DSM 46786]SEK40553.1 Acetyltransferase (GNAT) family protein [Blastococcus sp. DSM 46786]
MSDKPSSPVKLERNLDRSGFTSGATELDEWLRQYAWQNQRTNNVTTYVSHVGGTVVGYYAITVASYDRAGAPSSLVKGAPAQVPCILLARLAVDESWHGRGMGAALLRDALRRTVFISGSVGARLFLAHARDEAAHAFHMRHGDFIESPVEPLHLMVSIPELAKIPGFGSSDEPGSFTPG